jgi:hypothetical protein
VANINPFSDCKRKLNIRVVLADKRAVLGDKRVPDIRQPDMPNPCQRKKGLELMT